ncbi:hypothetical protein SUDANB121_02854 [Nocardiopsis dassonvillei]|uniref:hypothetical protein n=1 Tax=Nocardiopsis dassonvillei TaxID=2014 RepID=UPI003F54EB0E
MTGTTTGGFDVDPLDALAPPAQAGGCCGTPATTAAAAPADSSAGGCCGTAAVERQPAAGSGCCG